MRVFYFYSLLWIYAFSNPILGMQEEPSDPIALLDHHRPSQTFEPIDISTFPTFESAKDCIQFAHELVRSEKVFWTERQEELVKDFARLKVIVPILEKNILDLSLRFKLLSNPIDNSAYQLYKSHSKLINSIDLIYVILNDSLNTCMDYSPTEEYTLLRKLESRLVKEKELQRGNHRSISKLYIDPKHQETAPTGNFNDTLPDNSSRYSLCDVGYTPQVFCPAILSVLEIRIQSLSKQIESDKSLQGDSGWLEGTVALEAGKKKKKKKNNRGKKKIIFVPKSKAKIDQRVDMALPVEDVKASVSSQVATEFTEADISVLSKTNESPLNPHEASGTQEIIKADDLLPSLQIQLPTEEGPELGRSKQQKTIETDIAPERDPFTSWDKANCKGNQKINTTSPRQRGMLPKITLPRKCADVVWILLGQKDGNVKMSTFVKLLKVLGGEVSRGGKCLHFWARSPITGEWCSAAMHPLHGDKKTQIPARTPYWMILKRLLIELGFEELEIITK